MVVISTVRYNLTRDKGLKFSALIIRYIFKLTLQSKTICYWSIQKYTWKKRFSNRFTELASLNINNKQFQFATACRVFSDFQKRRMSLLALAIPWVPETFLAQFLVSIMSLWWPASPLVTSAFGQYRKFPPHARKTSGTQGTLANTVQKLFLPC